MTARILTALTLCLFCACSSGKSEPTPDPDAAQAFKSSLKAPESEAKEKAAADMPAGLPTDFVTTPSGLQYSIESVGAGEPPKPGQKVAVNYAGYLSNGQKFDASKKGRPFTFVVGKNTVIDGWEEGIRLMKTGSRVWFKVPPELGYGDLGSPPKIPPDATLIFYIELFKIYDK